MRSCEISVVLGSLALAATGMRPEQAKLLQAENKASWAWPFVGPLETEAFEKYPGYTGDLLVSGKVFIGDASEGSRVISASLIGTDPACDGTQTGAKNECGIHIHAGTDCTDAKGHFYDKSKLAVDPWTAVTYAVEVDPSPFGPEGAAKVSGKMVAMGSSLSESTGRVFVVHDSTGARVACAKLQPVSFHSEYPLKVETPVEVYPGYQGSLEWNGDVVIQQVGDTAQVVGYNGQGDPMCTEDFVVTKANGCGVHIHSGMTCDSAGDHHYDTASLGHLSANDPWANVRYVHAGHHARGVTTPIETGLGKDAILSRTVVVHDANGTRISCGRVSFNPGHSLPLQTQGFGKLESYQGVLAAVTGIVKVGQMGSSTQLLGVSLKGVDPRCDGTQTGEGNKCGIHVHSGTSCGEPGGHYFDIGLTEDPWQAITYHSGPTGTVEIPELMVTTGLPLWAIEHHVFVVHDSTGAKAFCAELKGLKENGLSIVGGFTFYPGYLDENIHSSDGVFKVSGRMVVSQVGDSVQVFDYALAGADPRCIQGGSFSGNACGIHIHEGNCSAESVGGHFYKGDVDPWVHVRYAAPGFAGVTLPIATGLSASDYSGKAMVVHDADAKRVACADIVPLDFPMEELLGGLFTLGLMSILQLCCCCAVCCMLPLWFFCGREA